MVQLELIFFMNLVPLYQDNMLSLILCSRLQQRMTTNDDISLFHILYTIQKSIYVGITVKLKVIPRCAVSGT